jgi:hypothetical protein
MNLLLLKQQGTGLQERQVAVSALLSQVCAQVVEDVRREAGEDCTTKVTALHEDLYKAVCSLGSIRNLLTKKY